MSQELLYTSAPRGLRPGSRGFCMVLCSEGMPAPLATSLEALSAYKPIYPPGHPQEAQNPVNHMHVIVSALGRRLHVLSRVASYGLDYSGRPNKLAHHVVPDSKEKSPAGPAWLLAQRGVMATEWTGEPRQSPASRPLPGARVEGGRCQAWAKACGDAGWAGVLAESLLADSNRMVYLIHAPGFDPFPLIAEAVLLLPPERRWEATFATCATSLPPGVTCHWRCLPSDSPLVHQSKRQVHALRINVTEPLPQASGGELVKWARTGVRPKGPPTAASAGPAAEPLTAPAGVSPRAGHHVEFAGGQAPPRLLRQQRSRTTIQAAVATILLSLAGIGYFYFTRPAPVAPAQQPAADVMEEAPVATAPQSTAQAESRPPETVDQPAKQAAVPQVVTPPATQAPDAASPSPDNSAQTGAAANTSSEPEASSDPDANIATEQQAPAEGFTEWVMLRAEAGRAVPLVIRQKLEGATRLEVLQPVQSSETVIASDPDLRVTREEARFIFAVKTSGLEGDKYMPIGTLFMTSDNREVRFAVDPNGEGHLSRLDGFVIQALDGSNSLVWQGAIASQSASDLLASSDSPFITPFAGKDPDTQQTSSDKDISFRFQLPLRSPSAKASHLLSLHVSQISLLFPKIQSRLDFIATPQEGPVATGTLHWSKPLGFTCPSLREHAPKVSNKWNSLGEPRFPADDAFPYMTVKWGVNSHQLEIVLNVDKCKSRFSALIKKDVDAIRTALNGALSVCKSNRHLSNIDDAKGGLADDQLTDNAREYVAGLSKRAGDILTAIETINNVRDGSVQPGTGVPLQKIGTQQIQEAVKALEGLATDSKSIEEWLRALQAPQLRELTVSYRVAALYSGGQKEVEPVRVTLVEVLPATRASSDSEHHNDDVKSEIQSP